MYSCSLNKVKAGKEVGAEQNKASDRCKQVKGFDGQISGQWSKVGRQQKVLK